MGLTLTFLPLIVNLPVRLVKGGLLWICATSKRNELDVVAEGSCGDFFPPFMPWTQ
jgi:hypothetical protein